MQLSELGFTPFFEATAAEYRDKQLLPARIAREDRERFGALSASGELSLTLSGRFRHHASRRSDLPAVGDWVMYEPVDDKSGVIHAVLPRRSQFSRQMVGVGEKAEQQILAANIDTVFILMGLDGNYNLRRVERYVTLAWESGATPVIILNKADLCEDRDERVDEVQTVAVGVNVHAISALEHEGLEALRPYLGKGKTVALLGSSGVGKSTLVNALSGEERMATQEVSDDSARGRHTTVHRQLLALPNGSLLIDTPGLRGMKIWADEESVGKTFEDIESLAAHCRFKDCQHNTEPGCAVKQALEESELDSGRFESYLKQKKELQYLARREDRTLQQIEKDKWKKIHASMRERYKIEGKRK